ncbi:DUF488 domain-containing protein [Bacillus methanolicus]|uniref:Uroporphyrin-III C-methyltransferase n=1 Tax=Bacillus methanolicus (strain MGA3 / ATCC 53907) TaxID=796606 RepID=I3EBE3_BACMM|nr:DUF488 domain-containing protein [Bacillus methanolicus]AIE61495.1 hypothetical protein BMMGA3_15710 [Bacillus methanolicus MGA3]EIJ83814.1 hypothetical protein MGA3_00905 [Bacillus methanolicus MGA3]
MVNDRKMANVRIKRIYSPVENEDGCRIFVDRLWPRGISKTEARWDLWFREVAPSPELRKWFGHKPERFADFRQRYARELAEDPVRRDKIEQLRELAQQGTITLLYAAKDERHNHAAVLRDVVLQGFQPEEE